MVEKSHFEIDHPTVWERIKSLYPGLSIPQMAEQIGVTKQSAYRWNEGQKIAIDTLEVIAKAKQVPLRHLLFGEERKQNDNFLFGPALAMSASQVDDLLKADPAQRAICSALHSLIAAIKELQAEIAELKKNN